ncbi:MAG: hypothetical protein QOC81_132 [Thermoanaerobaculia bacterium]|jgi:hypothetical protein|nr:hypothetical protein [Thermoanaerobaculia bacterium]
MEWSRYAKFPSDLADEELRDTLGDPLEELLLDTAVVSLALAIRFATLRMPSSTFLCARFQSLFESSLAGEGPVSLSYQVCVSS